MSDERQGRVVFDRSRWPLVVLHFPASGPIESVHRWYDELEAMLDAADRPLGLVHDLRAVDVFTATAGHRAAIAERVLRLRHRRTSHRIAADARIVRNAAVAAAASVVSWLHGPLPWPQRTFGAPEPALAWTQELLRAIDPERSHPE